MPINARQLQKDSRSVLHAIVEPHARTDGTPPAGTPSSAGDRRELSSSGDRRLREPSETSFEQHTAALTDGPWYRREPWLVTLLLAFAPILAAMVLPRAYHLPLFGVGGSLVVIGLVLLVRRELSASRSRSAGESRAS